MKKLIIWDFDGVIANTENLWVSSRLDLLNKYFGLQWNFETAMNYIGGRSDKDKKNVLHNLGIDVSDDFFVEANKIDIERLNKGVEKTPFIEQIFELDEFDQCIATGGVWEKTAVKVKQTGVEKYFNKNNIFTADLVKKGKPEPDLFLLAAKTMGFDPEDCFVVEDSLVGLTAAIRAKMKPIAFVAYNKPFIVEEIKKLNIEHIFDNMLDVKNFLIKNI